MPELVTKTSKRIIALDMMRGYFMVAIILNHLYWYPNGFDIVEARGELFVSAAEGFFLISGIILGIVRGEKLVNRSLGFAAKLLLNRSFQLYVTSVILMLIFTLLGWWLFIDNPGLKPGIRPTDEPVMDVILGAFTYKYIYGWADFLRLYVIFIGLSPIALWLMRNKRTHIMIGISVLAYLLRPLLVKDSTMTDEILMPITWQLVFFCGFAIGFHRLKIADWWNTLTHNTRHWVRLSVYGLTVLTVLANLIITFGSTHSDVLAGIFTALDPYFNKEVLPLPRVALFGLWFAAGFLFFRHFEGQIQRLFGWILLPFGENSLYVYTLHAFLVFLAHMVMKDASDNILINFVGTVLIFGLIMLALRTKFLMKIIPR